METYKYINTKSRDRKRKLQEELTGFDVEGHHVAAVLVGGIAKSSDVRGDLDTDHTLNDLLSLFLGCCLEDLAQKYKVKETAESRSASRKVFPFFCIGQI